MPGRPSARPMNDGASRHCLSHRLPVRPEAGRAHFLYAARVLRGRSNGPGKAGLRRGGESEKLPHPSLAQQPSGANSRGKVGACWTQRQP
jgi:hypothetical protein